MTSAIRRLPSAFRCTPLMRQRRLRASAYSALVGVNRSTNAHAARLGHLRHRLGVELEPPLFSRPSGRSGLCRSSCAIGENSTMRGADLPLYFCASVCVIQSSSCCLNAGSPASPRVGLVVAEEREDDVRLRVRAGEAVLLVAADRLAVAAQPLVGRAEVLRAQARRDLVAAEAEIADDQVVLRKARVQQRLEPAVVLHPLGERVADDADVIARAAARTAWRRRRAGASRSRTSRQHGGRGPGHAQIVSDGARVPSQLAERAATARQSRRRVDDEDPGHAERPRVRTSS